jgi:hypothetical protein
MNKQLFQLTIVALVLLSLSSIEGYKLTNGLTFLGSPKTRGIEGSLYFTSTNPTTWKEARELCVTVLGGNASLVNIETEVELAEIKTLLVSAGDRMTSFWTDGKYEENGRKIFSWGTSEQLGSWIWATGEPSRNAAGTSLVMKKDGSGNWDAYSTQETERHGLICELVPGSSAVPSPCYNTNDLVIVLDSSGSIGAADYELAKSQFVINVTTAWNGWDETRLEFLIYSDVTETIFGLNNKLTEFQMEDLILNARYLSAGTASDLALQKAYEDLTINHRDVTRNVVFLTDGQSNNRDRTKEQAQNLHRAGVRVFAVGISNAVEQELKDIASEPGHVFYTQTFAELKNLLKPITQRVCDN